MKLDVSVLKHLAAEQQVPLDTVVAQVTAALTDAYTRTPGAAAGAAAELDMAAGELTVVDADGADVTPTDFGRLAAAATRQAVTQWLRDVERIRKVGVWAGRENTLVTGTVRAHAARNKRGETLLNIGADVEATMPSGEATPGEDYRHGAVLTALVVAVNADDRGRVKVTVSRRQPTLVTALFTKYVPELERGSVEVVSVARDPGVRTKVAVRSGTSGLDAKAALIGPAADRIRRVAADLGGEKLDLVTWSPELTDFVAAALTPAQVLSAELVDPARKLVRVLVEPTQYALAYGRGGANVRLAQRLTGARIEVVPAT